LHLAKGVPLGRSSRDIAHAFPSAGITQFRFMRSAPGALSARYARAPAGIDLTGGLGLAPGSGEEVGEDAVHLGIESQANVAAVDLDRVDVRPQAGLPVDDAVRARIDRGGRDARGRLEVAQESHLDRGGMPVAHRVEEVRGVDSG